MKQLKKEYRTLDGGQLAAICAQIGTDGKGEDIVILDVRKISSFTDYFVILSGRSTRHVQALAESLEHELRSKRISSSRAEGLSEGKWVLLDFDDVVVHIFYHEQRDFYDLEGLWHDAPRLETQS
ncbi:MAG: ribosome silencing factor [Desulfofustis sp.]|nr:ribosome silencing factor [Desulfofustis sp.]NNF46925.1 ribosome silencing factor [Desulfofustis sp.]NNK14568.1 ribosome silencing factor [Desulfofustis sp.]NNK56361.1 ribosome silencing factor [Desulfofustis sp.]RZW21545.1 MAG: ribosome silencing factor [Desulfobulbaceae bacterium]